MKLLCPKIELKQWPEARTYGFNVYLRPLSTLCQRLSIRDNFIFFRNSLFSAHPKIVLLLNLDLLSRILSSRKPGASSIVGRETCKNSQFYKNLQITSQRTTNNEYLVLILPLQNWSQLLKTTRQVSIAEKTATTSSNVSLQNILIASENRSLFE